MANEIKAFGELVSVKNNFLSGRVLDNRTISQAAADVHVDTVTVTSTAANLAVGTITTPGWSFFQNISSNRETIYVGANVSSVFFSMVELRYKEFAEFRVDGGTTLMAKTTTNNGSLHYLIFEN